jgi:uncharacterized damage-inducible protein DinB
MDQKLIATQLIAETLRRINGEGIPRLRKCLAQLTEGDIWYRPNANSNAVGNLVLHLNGNVRQWVISTLGGAPDRRQRQREFDERGPLPTAHLLELLDELERDFAKTLKELTPDALTKSYEVQGFQETGTGILLHVAEHFSYHVGQITYFVKMKKDLDIGYYEEEDLDVTN